MSEAVAQLESRVSALEMRDAVDEVHRANITNRLSSIEDTLKWLVRLVIGGFVLATLSFLLQQGVSVT